MLQFWLIHTHGGTYADETIVSLKQGSADVCGCQVDQQQLQAARRLLQIFCLRRLKVDVEHTLPPRVIHFNIFQARMPCSTAKACQCFCISALGWLGQT